MAKVGPLVTLDIATLPLADGQQLLVPLNALAEVQQVNFAGRPAGDLGEFSWRGYELPIVSLDSLVGLPEPAPERLTTVGIFKIDKEYDPPFRAVAFSGIASPGRVEPSWLVPLEETLPEQFVTATELHDHRYLIPDLSRLFYSPEVGLEA
jgi:hypothetical protein